MHAIALKILLYPWNQDTSVFSAPWKLYVYYFTPEIRTPLCCVPPSEMDSNPDSGPRCTSGLSYPDWDLDQFAFTESRTGSRKVVRLNGGVILYPWNQDTSLFSTIHNYFIPEMLGHLSVQWICFTPKSRHLYVYRAPLALIKGLEGYTARYNCSPPPPSLLVSSPHPPSSYACINL